MIMLPLNFHNVDLRFPQKTYIYSKDKHLFEVEKFLSLELKCGGLMF